MEAHHSGAPGAWLWCLSAHCTCRVFCPWLAAHFLPFLFGVPRPRSASCPVAMSCASLQLSSRRWLRLRTLSRSASPGVWAPLVLVAPLLLPTLAHPQLLQPPQRLRWCPRPATRSQRLCCALRLSRLLPLGLALAPVPLRRCPNVHRVAVPAPPLACVVRSLLRRRDFTGLATKRCPPVPPPQLRLSRVSRAMTVGTLSSTHTASPRLLGRRGRRRPAGRRRWC